jgi:hypothetical protein
MSGELKITSPRDGDILNRHDGVETKSELTLQVKGTAPGNASVTVNGVAAEVTEGQFRCSIAITNRRTHIVAEAGAARDEILVLWDRGSRKRYRFSVDDNILFLRDLGTEPDRYASLFDHWFLDFWRQMHQEYGTKVHFNIYYQTEGFDLTQMPDKWRDEWEQNAGWLHLSFHALQNEPNRIYRNARYPQIAHDYDLVCGHIRRFASDAVLRNTTTIHWAECPRDAVTAVRHRGIQNLIGLFWVRDGRCTTGYYLPPEQCDYCHSRDAWYDRDTDLIFVSCDAVVNGLAVEQIEPHLDERAASPHTCELIELLIHEQYFRKDLPQYYQDTILEKVKTAVRWVSNRGYEPVFWGDGFLGTEDS